jgi:hypothetical protein
MRLFSLERNWLRLHAILLIKTHDLLTALDEQLHVDNDENFIDGIKIIIDTLKPKQLLNYTIANGDPRLLGLSAELCHKSPSYLKQLKVSNINWQNIWLEAVKKGNGLDEGLEKPQIQINKFLDLVVNDGEYNLELLERVSHSEYGNLLEYKNRPNIWVRLDAKVRDVFLVKTASTLLRNLATNPTIEIPHEPILQDFILKYAISDFLYYNSDNLKITLPVFEMFAHIEESVLENYIYNYPERRLEMIDAIQLGQLIKQRRYYRVARAIYSRTSNKQSPFRFALSECYELLGLWEQGGIALYGLLNNVVFTEDMWWEAFQETSYKLYPSGPRDRKIWVEAGGQEYDLLNTGTGKEQWIDALNKLRHGAFKGITAKKLLSTISKNYKNYEPLKMLRKMEKSL